MESVQHTTAPIKKISVPFCSLRAAKYPDRVRGIASNVVCVQDEMILAGLSPEVRDTVIASFEQVLTEAIAGPPLESPSELATLS